MTDVVTPPAISVLMPVHDGGPYLVAALDSVLVGQTFRDLELVVVDDGSTDASPRILRERAAADPRVRVITQAHLGVTAALNRGLDEVRGEFIARMDADDVAMPARLVKQLTYLRAHPRVGIVGSWVRVVDSRDLRLGYWKLSVHDLALRWEGLLEVPFCHPAVMMRRSVLESHAIRYQPEARAAEDYALFMRMLEHSEGANLPAVLLRYRQHAGSVNAREAGPQADTHLAIALDNVTRHFPELGYSRRDVAHMLSLFPGVHLPRPVDVARSVHQYLDLWDRFASRHRADPALRHAQALVALRLMRHLRSHGPRSNRYPGITGVRERALGLGVRAIGRAVVGVAVHDRVDRLWCAWDRYGARLGGRWLTPRLAAARRWLARDPRWRP